MTGAALVVVMAGLIGFALAHAQWSSSRSSSGLVNAGSLAEPGVITVDIDIKPGSDPNSTNLGSQGVISVAILTALDFDAATVDPATVDFEGASPVHGALEDVDGDVDLDLIMHFRTQDTTIADEAAEACLTGATFDGQAIEGCDAIRIVPHSLDSDGDGFGDAVEASMRTDQFAACAATNTANDEGPADTWPYDFNDNQRADLSDVLGYIPVFNSFFPVAPYDPRFDLDASGGITLGDVLSYIPVFNLLCTP